VRRWHEVIEPVARDGGIRGLEVRALVLDQIVAVRRRRRRRLENRTQQSPEPDHPRDEFEYTCDNLR
jgi:hypothetical protein